MCAVRRLHELKLRVSAGGSLCAEIRKWAALYNYPGDDELVALSPRVRKRRSYTREEFLKVSHWKSQRVRKRALSNGEALVEEVTRVALTAKHEQLRIGVLTTLNGVGWPTASTLLHFGHRDPYPILDFRALWSLGNEPPNVYMFEFWWNYVQCCRKLCEESGEEMRTVDRALWTYSSKNQKPR